MSAATRARETARWSWDEPPAPLLERLARGGVLALPTESSYGLAADPRNRRGVDAIYRVKGRPGSKPLPVVAADVAQLVALGLVADDPALRWALTRWPAPLTVVLPLAPGVDLPAAAGGDGLAVRIPAHRRLRVLLAELGPLTATSANRAGEPPVLDPAALDPLLAGEDAAIVDGGTLGGGPPSTLVRFRDGGLEVLRAGAFVLDPADDGPTT